MPAVTSSSDEDANASNTAEVPSPYAEEGFRVASLADVASELAARQTMSHDALAARGPWRGWLAELGPLEIHGRPGRALLLHAHGAGAGRETDFHQQFGAACLMQDMAWLAFDFGYLVRMRCESRRRPPPRLPGLIEEMARWCQALMACVAAVDSLRSLPWLVGGKSMGSRVASHLLVELTRAAHAPLPVGWYALGYPFHPTGKPDKLRIDHLPDIPMAGLICQGSRDPFGTREEVTAYPLPESLILLWLNDGEHDFKPRKASGETREGLISRAAQALANHPALGGKRQ